MARPERGSSASATLLGTHSTGFIQLELPLLLKLFCNQSCVATETGGHAQLAAGAIETGRAAGEGVLGLARFCGLSGVRDDTSQLVVAPAHRIGSMFVSLGMLPRVRRSRTGHVLDMFARDGHSGTLQGHWHWVDCPRAAFVRFWVADRSDSWSVLAFGSKWIISGWQPVRCGRCSMGGRAARARPAGFDWCAARRWFDLVSCIQMHR